VRASEIGGAAAEIRRCRRGSTGLALGVLVRAGLMSWKESAMEVLDPRQSGGVGSQWRRCCGTPVHGSAEVLHTAEQGGGVVRVRWRRWRGKVGAQEGPRAQIKGSRAGIAARSSEKGIPAISPVIPGAAVARRGKGRGRRSDAGARGVRGGKRAGAAWKRRARQAGC